MATHTTPCDETGNPYSATNPLPTSGALLAGDIEIGAVEIKDGVADIRQTVLAASTAAAATDKAAVVDLSPNGVVGAAGDGASLTGSLNAKLRAIATALGITALDLGPGTGGSRTLRWFMDTAQWIGGTGVVGTAVQRVTLATDVALPAGTALLGKVGIDQTVPGTTDSVSVKGSATAYSDASRLPVEQRDGLAIPSISQTIAASTFTVTLASPGVFTLNSHGLSANQPVVLTTSGALPTGLTASTSVTAGVTYYYVSATGLTTNTFQVSATVGGASVNTSGSQSGAHTLTPILFSQDMLGFESVSVQVTSAGTTCTITYETSDDNANWLSTVGNLSTNTAGSGSATSTAAGLNLFPKRGRYFRARVSTFTSGTVTALGTVHKHPATTNGSVPVSSEASTVGNFTPTGIEARTSSKTSVANAQATRPIGTVDGRLVARPNSIPENEWSYAAAASGISNTTAAVTIKGAAAAGVKNYCTGLSISWGTLGAGGEIAVRDGANGTVLWRGVVPTVAGTMNPVFPDPLVGTAATLMEFVTLTASVTGALYVNASGYIGP